MRRWLQSPAPIVLLILGMPLIAIAESFTSELPLRTSASWFQAGYVTCFVIAAVVLAYALWLERTLKRSTVDERAIARQVTAVVFAAAFAIDGLSLLFAIALPWVGVAVSITAIAWVCLWLVPRFRQSQVTSTFVIMSSPEAVFTFVSDARNLPRWYLDMPSAEMLTPEPVGAGSRFHWRVLLPNGGEVDAIEEIVDFQLNRRFTSRVPDALQPNLGTFTFEKVDGGTRLEHRFEFEHSFATSVLGAWFWQSRAKRRLITRRLDAESRIKQILEG